MDSMVFPRLLAIAERAWNKAPWDVNTVYSARQQAIDSEWVNFANTLGYKELERLDKMGIAYRIPPPEIRYGLVAETFLKARQSVPLKILTEH